MNKYDKSIFSDEQKDLNVFFGLLIFLVIAIFVQIQFFPSTKEVLTLIFASTIALLIALNRICHILLRILHKLDKD